ncbi:hypothetical protein LBMAG42_39470 [Deltaproteobacteria bacterium]|nr:hypothetical protein LBMAG42_39470 [Deltaproteobacteria bacterium]
MWLLPVSLLTGCNSYELFRVTGFEQATFNNNADILFIVDSSGSMKEESSALALNFEVFLGQLTSTEGSDVPRATLNDAVNNYVRESTENGSIIDYQLAITTTSANYSVGPTSGVDEGEAGTLTGAAPIVKRGDPDVAGSFRKNLACNTVYWKDSDLLSDPGYLPADDGSCPLPEGDEIPREYLECLCPDGWVEDEGAGTEEGLEAALDTLCRGSAAPPDLCWDDDEDDQTDPGYPIYPEDEGSIEGFIRPEANTLVVIISDEGDGSRRVPSSDEDPTPYLDIFSEFPNNVRFAVIGPAYHNNDGSCLDGAQTWGVERYQTAAGSTNGTYIDLKDQENGCSPTDWGENLTKLGELLNNQLTSFPLQGVPDVATIRVYTDGIEIGESVLDSGTVEAGTAVWLTGWTYDASENAVSFHGAAIPEYNSDVRIYYRPLGGVPRELPI